MTDPRPVPELIAWGLVAIASAAAIGLAVVPPDAGWAAGGASAATLALAVTVLARRALRRRVSPSWVAVKAVTEAVAALPFDATAADLDAIEAAAARLARKVALIRSAATPGGDPLQDSHLFSRLTPPPIAPALTRSALIDSPRLDEEGSTSGLDMPSMDGDMIGRLEPREFRWIDSSPAEQAFLGWSLESLRAMSLLDVVHPDHRELARAQLRAATAKGEAHDLVYRIRTARGEAKAVEIHVGVRYASDGSVDHLRCHVTDVTEKLRASRELRRRTKDLLVANAQLIKTNRALEELTDRYADLYQNAPAMHFSLSPDGTITECNDTMLRVLGLSREDLIGRPYVEILPEYRRPAFAAAFAGYLATGKVEVESRWRTRDGGLIDVLIAGTAVRGPDGEILHSRSIAQDITTRKALEAQLQEKNARLARAVEDLARKNAELDDFTHVVSHDLQEPLRSLIGFSSLLLEDYAEALGPEGRGHVEFLLGASRRMRALVRDLLQLSRAGQVTGEFDAVDLGEIVDQVIADHRATIAAKGAEVVVARPLAPAWGDQGRLSQMLGNLVGNALKYTAPGVAPRVEISATAGPSGAVTVSIKDNGLGIDPRHHEAIFQVFRRLHASDAFEGTGAGLAIGRKIALAHGGRIRVESAVGQGSTFLVELPGPPWGHAGPGAA